MTYSKSSKRERERRYSNSSKRERGGIQNPAREREGAIQNPATQREGWREFVDEEWLFVNGDCVHVQAVQRGVYEVEGGVMGSSTSRESDPGFREGDVHDSASNAMEANRIREKESSASASAKLQSTSSYGPVRRKENALASCAEDQLQLMRCYHDQNLPARLSRIARSMTAETQDEMKDTTDVFSAGCEMERKRFWECYYMKRHGGRQPPSGNMQTLLDAFSKPWFRGKDAHDDDEKG